MVGGPAPARRGLLCVVRGQRRTVAGERAPARGEPPPGIRECDARTRADPGSLRCGHRGPGRSGVGAVRQRACGEHGAADLRGTAPSRPVRSRRPASPRRRRWPPAPGSRVHSGLATVLRPRPKGRVAPPRPARRAGGRCEPAPGNGGRGLSPRSPARACRNGLRGVRPQVFREAHSRRRPARVPRTPPSSVAGRCRRRSNREHRSRKRLSRKRRTRRRPSRMCSSQGRQIRRRPSRERREPGARAPPQGGRTRARAAPGSRRARSRRDSIPAGFRRADPRRRVARASSRARRWRVAHRPARRWGHG